MIEIVTVYEAQHTDGYKDFGYGTYFKTEWEADSYSQLKSKGYSTRSAKVQAIEHEGKFYVLKSVTPITIYESDAWKEEQKKKALAKLTESDRKLLGLE